MPFKKISKNKYKSLNGKIYTSKQVELYYATEDFTKEPRIVKKKKKK